MLAHLVGGEDLPADRLSHHPGRGVYGLPLQVVIVFGDRAGVNADADFDSVLRVGGVVLLQGLLDGNGCPDRSHGGRKGDKESVPYRFAYAALKFSNLVMHDGCLQTEDFVGVPVATRPAQHGRADNIGHHDREHPGCEAAIRQSCLRVSCLAADLDVQTTVWARRDISHGNAHGSLAEKAQAVALARAHG
jgi:hypothetical protein